MFMVIYSSCQQETNSSIPLQPNQTEHCPLRVSFTSSSRFQKQVQSLSCVQLFATQGLRHASLPCPSLSPGVCSNSRPLNGWCHLTISSSVTLFSFCLQSFPASGSFPMSQLFPSGGQSTGTSGSASVLPGNIQGWFPLGLTLLISHKHRCQPLIFLALH